MSTEVIKTGAIYRVLGALNPVTWNRISMWTKASDLEFEDGRTAQAKVGKINGITTDPASITEDYVPSTKLLNGMSGETIFNITKDKWSETATPINDNGKNYYKYEVPVTKVFLAHPIVFLAYDDIPSKDTMKIFAKMEAKADMVNNKMIFYSMDNTVSIVLGVKGVL